MERLSIPFTKISSNLLNGLSETPNFAYQNIGFVLLIVTLITVFMVTTLIQTKRKNDYRKQMNTAINILHSIDIYSDLTKQLNTVLDFVMEKIEAESYSIYLWDSTCEQYILHLSRYRMLGRGGTVGVSYSGLTPYEKEKYCPPMELSEILISDSPAMIKEGEVPLLRLVIPGEKVQIRIGPIKRISTKKKKELQIICQNFEKVIQMVLAMDRLNKSLEVISTIGKGISELSQSAFQMETMGSKIMAVSLQMIEAGGCCFAVVDHNGKWKIPFQTAINSDVDSHFQTDNEALDILYEVVKTRSSVQIEPDSKEFYCVPYYLVASGIQTVLLVEIPDTKGMVIFFFNRVPCIEKNTLSVVQMMIKRLSEFWSNKEKLLELSESYVGMTKMLIDSTDQHHPTTVGHSESIANYATAICVELNLHQREIESIRMAAYFHDIGMLGLSKSILHKQGKYSELEYESMKLHAIVGSSIIESLTSKEDVALYIRHHHERWDGLGYPDNLKQEHIPLGARVITVADTFNAKLQGRKYRDPVLFTTAVSDLQAVSGTQLDPKIVQALISWLNKKRKVSRNGRSMGACWEMRCCPIHICKNCPAFERKDANCWDNEGVKCSTHGSECSTCFVRTEVLSRDK